MYYIQPPPPYTHDCSNVHHHDLLCRNCNTVLAGSLSLAVKTSDCKLQVVVVIIIIIIIMVIGVMGVFESSTPAMPDKAE